MTELSDVKAALASASTEIKGAIDAHVGKVDKIVKPLASSADLDMLITEIKTFKDAMIKEVADLTAVTATPETAPGLFPAVTSTTPPVSPVMAPMSPMAAPVTPTTPRPA